MCVCVCVSKLLAFCHLYSLLSRSAGQNLLTGTHRLQNFGQKHDFLQTCDFMKLPFLSSAHGNQFQLLEGKGNNFVPLVLWPIA